MHPNDPRPGIGGVPCGNGQPGMRKREGTPMPLSLARRGLPCAMNNPAHAIGFAGLCEDRQPTAL